jgi:dUTP pyrophosphatase
MQDKFINTIEIPTIIQNEDFLPFYTTEGAAGADIKAFLEAPLIIPSQESALIPTGIRLAIPIGYEVQIRPRSGLALNHQVTVLNTPGTIDSDYRGEIKVILINHGKSDFTVAPGMRIAQFILAPVMQAKFVLERELASTGRGTGGFGHTGG